MHEPMALESFHQPCTAYNDLSIAIRGKQSSSSVREHATLNDCANKLQRRCVAVEPCKQMLRDVRTNRGIKYWQV